MKNLQRPLHPESQMMSYGYNPFWSEGALKPPIFQTSTFEFATAEQGKAFFSRAYGKTEDDGTPQGLIYSRLNNPNLEIFEQRLCLWDHAQSCAAFNSGMAAISTALMAITQPGDTILCSLPIYGGTYHFLQHVLNKYGINTVYFLPGETHKQIVQRIENADAQSSLSLIYVETPANPTNQLIDLELCNQIKHEYSHEDRAVCLAVDNTFMGPIWQQPLDHGVDVVLYSATKYIGGHSDLIAGAALGSQELINQIKGLRTFLGNAASPHTSWLLTRSLETLQVRMERQQQNAQKIAAFLNNHDLVNKIYYLGILNQSDQIIANNQMHGTGAMISFEIHGGEHEAFQFLDALTLIKLAVSLGGTESLAQHPKTMTHTDMDDELKKLCGVSDGLIRLSIGLENTDDLIDDLKHAFNAVQNTEYSGLSS